MRSPLTMSLGPNDVMLDLDVDFADDLTSVQMAIAVERLQDAIRVEHPEVQRNFYRGEKPGARHRRGPHRISSTGTPKTFLG